MDKGSELNTTKANRFFNQEKKDSLKKFISIPLHDYKKSACTRSIPGYRRQSMFSSVIHLFHGEMVMNNLVYQYYRVRTATAARVKE